MRQKIIAILQGGKMTAVSEPGPTMRSNFVICCNYGDWSGFRTLPECESQYRELEQSKRPDGFYWVEER